MNRIVRSTGSYIYRHSKVIATIVILMATVLNFSCKKNDQEFILGSEFLESSSDIRRIDTFKVELSTVIIDSFPTNNYSVAMVGHFDDQYYGTELGYGNMMGKVTCASYFQMGVPSLLDILDDDVYDSACFVLSHTGYSYGDTLQDFAISLYPLSRALESDDRGYIYSSTSFGYLTTENNGKCSLTQDIPNNLIGTITYKPEPNSYRYDSVLIHVNDTIGQRLYTMLLNYSDTIKNDNNFLDCIKGIAMVTDTNQSKAIINFDVSRLKLRLYYHRYVEDKVELHVDFPVTNKELQYNKIKHDFKDSKAQLVKTQRQAISSAYMENTSFLYGGVGLMTRIRFPTLPNILLYENSFVVKAELVLKPKIGTYEKYNLPTEIIMYRTNAVNDLGTIYYNYDGTTPTTATFIKDPYDIETGYTFDLTSYVTNELADSYFDVNNGILLSNMPVNFIKSFERLILDGEKPILKIYYVTY